VALRILDRIDRFRREGEKKHFTLFSPFRSPSTSRPFLSSLSPNFFVSGDIRVINVTSKSTKNKQNTRRGRKILTWKNLCNKERKNGGHEPAKLHCMESVYKHHGLSYETITLVGGLQDVFIDRDTIRTGGGGRLLLPHHPDVPSLLAMGLAPLVES
jgi:hypothetical protein